MQHLHKRISVVLASAFGVAALTVAPVWADHGKSVVNADSSTTSSETDTSTASTTDVSGTDTPQTMREKAQALVQTKRANIKQHTVAQKQKACEAHAAEINKRATNYATAAQRHLDVFNKIFTRVQAFETTKQLNVANYDTLVATATTKQTDAQTAVDNLKALDVSIDCTQTDPASTVATLKTTTANARVALQAYRQAIKDVVVALKGASTAQTDKSTTNTTTDTSTTGGDQ
jgi:hypothetical protein